MRFVDIQIDQVDDGDWHLEDLVEIPWYINGRNQIVSNPCHLVLKASGQMHGQLYHELVPMLAHFEIQIASFLATQELSAHVDVLFRFAELSQRLEASFAELFRPLHFSLANKADLESIDLKPLDHTHVHPAIDDLASRERVLGVQQVQCQTFDAVVHCSLFSPKDGNNFSNSYLPIQQLVILANQLEG